MIDPISATLTIVAEKFFSTLVSKVTNKATDELWSKLQNEPTQIAFKLALGNAIQNYASNGSRLSLSEPLLKVDGLLSEDRVIDELTQIIRFNREPNYKFIGERWKLYLENPPQWRNFTSEAKLFADCLTQELRNTSVFKEIFDTKSLDALADYSEASLKTLIKVENQLERLHQLLSSNFGELNRSFAASPLHAEIRDFSRLIEEKTQDFVGRNFVFEKIQDFLITQKSGYLFVRGDPGIGKSAFLAQLVKTHGYIHHFNIQAEGINKPSDFLTNVCAQLIVAHHLEYASLPSKAGQDSGFLVQILKQISEKLHNDEKVVIAIDALDEANNQSLSEGANTLFLPIALPPGVFVVATMRRIQLPLRIECAHEFFDINHNSELNEADIREYIQQATAREGIQRYTQTQGIDSHLFTENMTLKSQGNFMYLYYVFFEIEHGIYQNRSLADLPVGLQNYYEDHWRRMGMQDYPLPVTKLKIIYVLCEIKRPASRQLIADFAQEKELTIQSVLDEWQQFLHGQYIENKTHYNVYHASFRDFLHRKDIVQAAGVDISGIHRLITDNLWSELFADA